MRVKQKIYFRADGNAQMGLGHVIRSLALADMLKEDFECHFIIRSPLEALRRQILESCESLIELPNTEDDLEEALFIANEYLSGNEIVVLDGYHFVTAYQQHIKDTGCKLVCIDDIHAFHFVADAVINHAPGLHPMLYSIEPYTKLYTGLDYSLLRKPFLDFAAQKRQQNQIKNIFICFGGSDFNNCTQKVLSNLIDAQLDIDKVNIVMGSANPHQESVRWLAKQVKNFQVDIHQNLTAQEMSRLLSESDLGIVPASGILYEAICIKMPIISGYYVDNQIDVYKGFKNIGLIFGVGNFNEPKDYAALIQQIAASNIQSILDQQHHLQYGQSPHKLLDIFKSQATHSKAYSFRRAQSRDLKLLFNWANDKAVRANALNSDPITFTDHQKWFNRIITDPDTLIFILESSTTPIGQIRFNIDQGTAKITYSIASSSRGKGWGKIIISEGIKQLIQLKGDQIHSILAEVKTDNLASNKIFNQNGFQLSHQEHLSNFELNFYIRELKR